MNLSGGFLDPLLSVKEYRNLGAEEILINID